MSTDTGVVIVRTAVMVANIAFVISSRDVIMAVTTDFTELQMWVKRFASNALKIVKYVIVALLVQLVRVTKIIYLLAQNARADIS